MEDEKGIKPEIILKEDYKLEEVPDEFSEGLIDEFKRNIVWVALNKLVEEHTNLLKSLALSCPPTRVTMIDNVGKIHTMMGVEYYQGCIEECENFKTLPDRLLNQPKEIKDEPTK